MFKKLLKLVTVFSLLLGCYLGYVRAFSIVVAHLTAARKIDEIGFTTHDSKLQARGDRCGPGGVRARPLDHQRDTATPLLTIPNAASGCIPRITSGRSRKTAFATTASGSRLSPAAIIWRAQRRQQHQDHHRRGSDHRLQPGARLSTSSPTPSRWWSSSPGSSGQRDDPRRPRDARTIPTDDMVIGPLTWVDYDDEQASDPERFRRAHRRSRHADHGPGHADPAPAQSRSRLKPARTSPGSRERRAPGCSQNVHVVFSDVGKTGILPGSMTTQASRSRTRSRSRPG